MLRRSACLILILLALAGPATAQTIGVKGGLDLTSLGGDTADLSNDIQPLVGFTGGGFVRFGLGGRFALQTEGLVSNKRTRFDDTITHAISYLDVPAVLRVRLFGPPDGKSVHLIAGGMYSRVLSASETVSDQSFDLKDGIAANDVGVVVGADVQLAARWSIDARYVQGTMKVYHTRGDDAGLHWTFQATLTCRLFGG